MNKRLQMLEKLTASPAADSFAFYALALEYRKAERFDDARATFERLRERDPQSLPMYLIAAQLLGSMGQPGPARPWPAQGSERARGKGAAKARSELESALSEL